MAYFVLLSLLPLAATYWGFSTVAGAGQSRQVTARQETGLRAALALYGIQIVRIAMRRGIFSRASWAYAVLMVLAKFAGFWGILVYIWRSLLAKPALLIEYKEARTSR